MLNQIGKLLVIGGIALLILGGIYLVAARFGLGRLPGDISFRRGNVSCFFPIATSIILSILLTLIVWLLRGRG